MEKEEEIVDAKVLETVPSTEGKKIVSDTRGGGGGGESSKQYNNPEVPSSSTEGDSSKTLELASELMEKGSAAMKASDYAEAAECFSRAVEIRVTAFGELSPACCNAYYKYGCALLYKAQEEADPLGVVPKKNSGNDASAESVKDESSVASPATDDKHDGKSIQSEREPDAERDGAGENDQVEDDDNDGSEGDDVADQDEDDSELDLAWKMLDVARAISEQNQNDTMEKVDILTALGEVALEREDIETSLSDYMNALSILERLVEPDSRQIAELNFRICLVLEVGSKPEEAVPYCQKAISICKARIQRLRDQVKSLSSSSSTVVAGEAEVVESESNSADSDKEAEIETLSGLASELEKKLEDLQQMSLHPTSIFADVLKMISARSTGGEKDKSSAVLDSSQMGINQSISGDIESPTVSTAHTNGNSGVTHLGVVGRGVKRVNMTPISADSSTAKKPSLDTSVEKGQGSGS